MVAMFVQCSSTLSDQMIISSKDVTMATIGENLRNTWEGMHVGDGIHVEEPIIINPLRISSGVGLRNEETWGGVRGRGWLQPTHVDVLLQEMLPYLTALLWALILTMLNGHGSVFQVKTMENIVREVRDWREHTREAILKVFVHAPIFVNELSAQSLGHHQRLDMRTHSCNRQRRARAGGNGRVFEA